MYRRSFLEYAKNLIKEKECLFYGVVCQGNKYIIYINIFHFQNIQQFLCGFNSLILPFIHCIFLEMGQRFLQQNQIRKPRKLLFVFFGNWVLSIHFQPMPGFSFFGIIILLQDMLLVTSVCYSKEHGS